MYIPTLLVNHRAIGEPAPPLHITPDPRYITPLQMPTALTAQLHQLLATVDPHGTPGRRLLDNSSRLCATVRHLLSLHLIPVPADTAALDLAKRTFMWLEKHSHDPVYRGYYQHLQRDGTPIQRTAAMSSTAETGYKDQNSSIHLLEAFTELYGVWKDPVLKERLTEMLLLIRDKIVTPRGNLQLFFKPDWTPISYYDSSRTTILAHRGLDHVSFGHDVETAYLMLEASRALGRTDETKTLAAGKHMVDHALRNGWVQSTAEAFSARASQLRRSAPMASSRRARASASRFKPSCTARASARAARSRDT